MFAPARAQRTTVHTVNKAFHYQQEEVQLEGLEDILPSIPCVGARRCLIPQKAKEEIEDHVHVHPKDLVIVGEIGDQFSINCTCVHKLKLLDRWPCLPS